MSDAFDRLQASLVRLRQGGVRVGLPAPAAAAFVRAVEGGTPIVQAAASAGFDARVAAVAGHADVEDLPAVLSELTATAAEVDSAASKLRAAGFYPLVLAVSVVIAGVAVGGAAFPALSRVSAVVDAGVGLGPWVTLAGSAGLLVALGLSVLGRVHLPWVGAGWDLVERFAFTESLRVLVHAGAPLPVALRASARWSRRAAARSAAEGLAHSLEAGRSEERPGPLLHSLEWAMLASAAGAGTVPETIAAIAAQRRVALSRLVPDAVVRIHASALVLAGTSIGVLGVSFYLAYGRALAG